MKKLPLIASMIVIMVASIFAGAGTMAYFSAEVTSTGNTFAAGTFVMSVGSGSVSNTWTIDNWAPGETVDGTLTITNDGTLDIAYVKIRPTLISDSDGTYPLSKKIIIEEFTVVKGLDAGKEFKKTMSHMEGWMDASGGSYPGIFGDANDELTLAEFGGSHGYWFITGIEDSVIEPGETMTIYFNFLFDETAGDNYQGDKCTFTLTVHATQGPIDYTQIGDWGYGA